MPTDTYSNEPMSARNAVAEIGATGSELASFRTLSEHDRQAITAVIESKHRNKLAQDQAREDIKAVADKLGMKSSELNRIVSLAMLERERGNVLTHEKALIEVAEQVYLGFR